jgi:molybdate transport system substrate-binding protein
MICPRAFRGLLAGAVLLPAFAAACGGAERPAAPAEIVLSAASSLTGVLTELSDEYVGAYPGVVVRNNFGASGTLEQQIRRGAGVDLFISAANRQMDALVRDGLIEESSRRVLAGNELVLVAPASAGGAVKDFGGLASAGVARVAMGTPASVPAGEYARAALESMRLWEKVRPKVVFTTNVRQALTYAERGEVDAALVYRSDTRGASGVRVVAVAPPGSHAPIVYPAALLAAAAKNEAAAAYLEFLSGPAGAAAFRRHGFTAAPRAER